ncbi:GNAT family N-acetyltransferase [Bacillus sp. EAC]|uniref:GNAT family N-acetyltransferase n=1 Tax=Bacillus sp. EAC TaxID=1978338 RepID=UPI00211AE004|nr:GNAT family N-acetyltransferase [Bacillus sp. EAC]
MTELELIKLHATVLFMNDDMGRITFINEQPFDVAPKFYLGCTKRGNIVKYSNSLGEEFINKIERVFNTEQSIPIAEIINILSKDQPITNIWFGPAYVFPDVKDRKSKAIKITNENKEFLLPHFPYTFKELEEKSPCYAIIENNQAVSICCSARQTEKAAEASLYTLEDFRGKEYGIEVTNAWAIEIQNQNRIALYSTSFDNFSSQSIAKKLKLIQFGTDIHIS